MRYPYYRTPNGVQYFRPAPPRPLPTGAALAWAVAPALLPMPASAEHPSRATPGVQVSVTGLLGSLFTRSRQPTAPPVAKPAGIPPLDAYVQWTLTNANGAVVRTGTVVAPVTPNSQATWAPLDLPLDIDLSSEEARTGTLRIQEMNDGSQAVYFDSLTITHPQDRALVTQEQHYYPFGMAMNGVAVNTLPQVPNVSKDQFNDGSALQDDLLGAEGGVYSTFYRTYDPTTGRFTGMDPLADKYADWTPYQFALGNPIAVNDPTGALSTAEFQAIVDQLWANIGGYGNSGGSGGSGGNNFATWNAVNGFPAQACCHGTVMVGTS